ncbi:MAG: glycosyltransferase family 2 protein [Phycisphaerae bacterium]
MSTENTDVTLSVVIPCYNEAASLRRTAETLTAYLESADWNGDEPRTWEVIFVNDGSADETSQVLTDIAANDGRFVAGGYGRNGGQGKALQWGFARCRGKWIICFDADLDYAPDHLERFMKLAAETDADCIVASPFIDGGGMQNVPGSRVFMSAAMNWFLSMAIDRGISTWTCNLRLWRAEKLRQIPMVSQDKDLLPEMLVKARHLEMKLVECPATLIWGEAKTSRAGMGKGVLFTAAKSLEHFAIGLAENPLRFLLAPAVPLAFLTVVMCLWMLVAPGALVGRVVLTLLAADVLVGLWGLLLLMLGARRADRERTVYFSRLPANREPGDD